MPHPRPLAVSIGDPAGVGPELIAAAWAARREAGLPPFCVVGSPYIVHEAGERRGVHTSVVEVSNFEEAVEVFPRALPLIPTFNMAEADYTPGVPNRTGAQLALESLDVATGYAVSGDASGIVTMPIAKSRLADVGFAHPGQTEFVAAVCGVAAEDAVMMLAGPSLRTVPLTVHIALADVPAPGLDAFLDQWQRTNPLVRTTFRCTADGRILRPGAAADDEDAGVGVDDEPR